MLSKVGGWCEPLQVPWLDDLLSNHSETFDLPCVNDDTEYLVTTTTNSAIVAPRNLSDDLLFGLSLSSLYTTVPS